MTTSQRPRTNKRTYSANDIQVATSQLEALKQVANGDMPEVYAGSLDAFMSDWYPDFSWNANQFGVQAQLMIDLPEFPQVADDIQARFNFDMRKELEDGVAEACSFPLTRKDQAEKDRLNEIDRVAEEATDEIDRLAGK